ncbi:MAG: hypothetical protein Q7J46_15965 [Pseudomonas sp.]|jgi:hypothetical protein|nr:hypothetical protein [Pseudomonas sp.]
MTHPNDTLIGAAPSSIVDAARLLVTPYEGRVAEYNIATWLHLPGLANLPVSLLVSYRDGDKHREVSVDHGKVGPHHKILLSGVARLPVKHKVEDMRVYLRSAVLATTLVVEELFIQALEAPRQDNRQASA